MGDPLISKIWKGETRDKKTRSSFSKAVQITWLVLIMGHVIEKMDAANRSSGLIVYVRLFGLFRGTWVFSYHAFRSYPPHNRITDCNQSSWISSLTTSVLTKSLKSRSTRVGKQQRGRSDGVGILRKANPVGCPRRPVFNFGCPVTQQSECLPIHPQEFYCKSTSHNSLRWRLWVDFAQPYYCFRSAAFYDDFHI